MKRLIRKSDYPVTDWFHNEESEDINDEDATKIHYGPSLDREQQWLFEDSTIENPEWALRDSMGSKLK